MRACWRTHRLAAAMFAGELNFIVPVGGLDRSYSHGHETFGADEMPHECRRFRPAGLGHCNLLHQEGLPECINRLKGAEVPRRGARWTLSRVPDSRLSLLLLPPSASGSDFCSRAATRPGVVSCAAASIALWPRQPASHRVQAGARPGLSDKRYP